MPFLIIDDSTPVPPGGAILEDDFVGSAGTINGRAPNVSNVPGNTWSVVAGTVALSGSGSVPLSGGDNSALIQLGMANGFYIESEMEISSGGYAAVIANAASYNNSWEFGVYGGGSQLEAYYNIGGGYASAGNLSASVPASTPFTLRIEVTSTGFDCFLNGTPLGNISRSGNTGLDAETIIGFIGAVGPSVVYNYKVD